MILWAPDKQVFVPHVSAEKNKGSENKQVQLKTAEDSSVYYVYSLSGSIMI